MLPGSAALSPEVPAWEERYPSHSLVAGLFPPPPPPDPDLTSCSCQDASRALSVTPMNAGESCYTDPNMPA